MSIIFKLKRRALWLILSRLPKNKNKVVLQSFYGRGYSDSPKAIAEELRKREGFELYWVVKGEEEIKTLPGDIKPVIIDSAASIYHLCTAGFWVDNARKWAFTQKGKKQYYIQTWHGFPLKRIEKDAGDALPPDYIEAAKKDSSMADLFVSNSGFLSDIYRNGFWYSGEIIEGGFPRNDILVLGDNEKAEKARKTLKLDKNKKYLLYAPTFRKGMGIEVYDIDYNRCVNALESRFGGAWSILIKLHPNMAKKASEMNLNPDFCVNVSDYPDIQNLYLLSDAMISDYSSVMFDYIATEKPCFLYVNDLSDYKDDRNFYFDIEKLPFMRAENNRELEEIIKGFDAKSHKNRLEAFTKEFGLCESGESSARIADKMEEVRKGWNS